MKPHHGPATRFTEEELAALDDAADVLDALWDFDAVRGAHDARDGAEYRRLALGPKLRAIAGEEE